VSKLESKHKATILSDVINEKTKTIALNFLNKWRLCLIFLLRPIVLETESVSGQVMHDFIC